MFKFNFNETFDRVIVKKSCLVKGDRTKEVECSSSFDSSEQIANIMYWARDAIGPVEVFVDEATIRPVRDEERLPREEIEE